MKLIRILLILNYLFWGFFLFQGIGELLQRNAWFDLFEIQKIKPLKIEFIPQEKETTEIKYTFKFRNKIYNGGRKVINKIIKERLPKNTNDIKICVNTTFPKTNFINELGLKTRSGYVGIVISLIFICFFGLIDLFGNKKKWSKIYRLE